MPSQLVDPRALAVGVRFLSRLPRFLRHPLSHPEAREAQRARLANRRASFLRIMRDAIYAHPDHPLHRLLAAVGCEFGDLEAMVGTDGIEETLQALMAEGVYVTVDEFKGRMDIVRGSVRIEAGPARLTNPLAEYHVPARTGGSRSAGTPLLFDLEFIRACGTAAAVHLTAWGGESWLKATWETPGAGARFRLLKFASAGAPPAAWFTQVDPAAPGLDPVFRWSDRALRLGGLLAGVPMPRPMLATLDDPMPVARWMKRTLDAGEVPFLFGIPSSVVRLSTAAMEAGIDLGGSRSVLGGEPITEARLDHISKAGVRALPRYGTSECGPVGYGCLQPSAPDDVHLVRDLNAVVQAGRQADRIGVPPGALFVTSLHHAAPYVMLNFSMGDQAVMEARSCGCRLEAVGWTTHLRNIRSFEKLTAGGVTFIDTDLVRVLETVLPERFGGSPLDYQLVETERGDGAARLTLVVHPRLGDLREEDVASAFLAAIAGDRPIDTIMASMLSQGGTVTVERRAPATTRSGKVMHLHAEAG